MNTYKILSSAKINKLKEYSRSYGNPTIEESPYLFVYANKIVLVSALGYHMQTLMRGTKKLISFDGTEISVDQFDSEVAAAKKENEERKEVQRIADEKKWAEAKLKTAEQLKAWELFLEANPEKVSKYRAKVETKNSSKWRNYLRMKAAEKIAGGSFENLYVSPGELKAVLYK